MTVAELIAALMGLPAECQNCEVVVRVVRERGGEDGGIPCSYEEFEDVGGISPPTRRVPQRTAFDPTPPDVVTLESGGVHLYSPPRDTSPRSPTQTRTIHPVVAAGPGKYKKPTDSE